MAEEGHKVTLNIYDLSQGLARQLSMSFLGKAIEGIWHTGVVVYGNEYYFGGGIQQAPAGKTQYGTPIRVFDLGVTHVPKEIFEEYLQEISPQYTAESYSLMSHNCNNFSNEVSQFLVGATIPHYILQLPNEVMNSPMGALIMPMIQQLETTMRAGAVPQAPQFRPQAAAQPSQTKAAIPSATSKSVSSPVKSSDNRTTHSGNTPQKALEPRAAPSTSAVNPSSNEERIPNGEVAADPLGNARSRVQEEITREFATLMATGSLHASEAAALATRRVMQRYGMDNMTM